MAGRFGPRAVTAGAGTLQIPTSDGKAWRPAVRDKQPVSVALYTHCIATAHIIDRELPAA